MCKKDTIFLYNRTSENDMLRNSLFEEYVIRNDSPK